MDAMCSEVVLPNVMSHILVHVLCVAKPLSHVWHQADNWTNENIVNWTSRNKLQWNLNQNTIIFIKKNEFENVVC